MKLELKAKHFEGTEFCFGECAIEKAYNELTGRPCSEGINLLIDLTNNTRLRHKDYRNKRFESDRNIAQTHNWDETVIRTIELTEV